MSSSFSASIVDFFRPRRHPMLLSLVYFVRSLLSALAHCGAVSWSGKPSSSSSDIR
jgi:hypothetical protein